MKLSKLLFALSFVVIGVVFYVLNCYSTFVSDDILYSFIYQTPNRIRSLYDIYVSQVYHYLHINGRFIVHYIVQLFCGILGIKAYHACNTLVFLFFIFSVYIYIRKNVQESPALLSIILLMMFFFLPVWGLTMIGCVSSGVNYLWCGLFNMLFVLLYDKERNLKKIRSLMWYVVFFIFAVIVGSLQESFSVGIAAYLFCYYTFNYKLFKGAVVPLVIGYLFGCFLLIIAPGNFDRFEQTQNHASYFLKILSNSMSVIIGQNALLLLIITIIILWVKKRDMLLRLLKEQQLLVCVIFFNTFFASFIAYTSSRQLFCVSLFAIIILILLLYNLAIDYILKYKSHIIVLSSIFLLIISFFIYKERKNVFYAYDELWKNGVASVNGIIVDEKYDSICANKRNWLFDNFVRYHSADAYFRRDELECMSYYMTNGKNKYHCNVILPDSIEKIMSYCNSESQVEENIYKPYNKPYYVVRTINPSDNILNITKESYPKYALINLIKTGKPYTCSFIPLSNYRDHFTFRGVSYYIVRESNDIKILNIRLLSKK